MAGKPGSGLELDRFRGDLEFEARLRGRVLRFATTWGLFSPKAVDEGSAMLLEALPPVEGLRILDVGCGYGPIGLGLAGEAASVHLVDKDFVAVEYTRRNLLANGLINGEVYLSNGLRDVPAGETFDLVVSNLPAKVGNELLWTIMADAREHLAPGGRLCVVTIAGLKDFIKRSFKDLFGNFKKLKQGKTWMVSLAEIQGES